MTVGNLQRFSTVNLGETSPNTTQTIRKASAQLQSKIINEINNISDTIDIIKDTLLDGVDELVKIESELNEIKKKQGIFGPKGEKNNG